MSDTRKPGLVGLTYFDPHSGEFSESPPRHRKGLVKMPNWCAMLLGPVIGLLFVLFTPLVLIRSLIGVIFFRAVELASMLVLGRAVTTPQDTLSGHVRILRHGGVSTALKKQDRKLARSIVKEVEKEFEARLSQN